MRTARRTAPKYRKVDCSNYIRPIVPAYAYEHIRWGDGSPTGNVMAAVSDLAAALDGRPMNCTDGEDLESLAERITDAVNAVLTAYAEAAAKLQ
jgi:hypothetical protein